MLHLDGSQHLLPDPGAQVLLPAPDGGDGKVVGTLTSTARHHELGPVGLAVLKRNVPEDRELLVSGEISGQTVVVSAAQEIVVPGEGMSVDRPEAHGPLTRGLRGPSSLI